MQKEVVNDKSWGQYGSSEGFAQPCQVKKWASLKAGAGTRRGGGEGLKQGPGVCKPGFYFRASKMDVWERLFWRYNYVGHCDAGPPFVEKSTHASVSLD